MEQKPTGTSNAKSTDCTDMSISALLQTLTTLSECSPLH